jgi:hypothetical protein
MVLRDYGKTGGIPTLIDAPHAGHAMIADYYDGQSLVQTMLANGIGHVALTDWKSATPDMRDLEVDNYSLKSLSRSRISAPGSILLGFVRAAGCRR